MAKRDGGGYPHQHISKQYDQELLDVRARVLALGGVVEQQVEAAVEALLAQDAGLAARVVEDDAKVDSLEVSIDDECLHILALRQPVSSDLRFVVGAIKTVAELERIGDEAKRIARQAIDLASHSPLMIPLAGFEQMGGLVRHLLREALDAFARMDAAVALRVLHGDRRVDKEYGGIVRQQIAHVVDGAGSPIHASLDILWSARSLERIGDRSCNICEHVVYYAKGKNIRHASLEQAEQELRDV